MNAAVKAAKYSARELVALRVLRSKKKVTTAEVEDAIYLKNARPFNSAVTAAGVLRSLMNKAAHNGEPWSIVATQHGRNGTIWEIKR